MTETPQFYFPKGNAAKVSIIDSTLRMYKMPSSYFLEPEMKGMEFLPGTTTWSFLVESASGKRVIFDLGAPKNTLENSSPETRSAIIQSQVDLHIEKDVVDILEENGMQASEIDSVIWSHHHFDHIGDVTRFPGSTELVVGQGFKEAYCPGYPTDPESAVREVDFEGRELREINFDTNPLKLGPFRAFDFFDDGSFYLLDTPGHAIGHLAGLARTTTGPETFILMGGDICHHSSQLRPSPYLPIPPNISEHMSLSDSFRLLLSRYPGSALDNVNIKRGLAPGGAFFDPTFGDDIEQVKKTIREAQTADAQDNIFFIAAHDASVMGIIDTFPKTANYWKAKGWKEKTFWRFLEDFESAIKEEAKCHSS